MIGVLRSLEDQVGGSLVETPYGRSLQEISVQMSVPLTRQPPVPNTGETTVDVGRGHVVLGVVILVVIGSKTPTTFFKSRTLG